MNQARFAKFVKQIPFKRILYYNMGFKNDRELIEANYKHFYSCFILLAFKILFDEYSEREYSIFLSKL